MNRNALGGAAALVFLAGVACIGQGLWIPAKARLAQALLESAWARTLSGEERVRPWPWADTWPVARLLAPGPGQDVIVLAGASGRTLAFGPAHVPASARPGEADNIALAGHRDTHFAFLRELTIGDELVLENPRGLQRFRVEEALVLHETETEVLARSGRAELTLITCYPFDAVVPGGPLRFVVRAVGTEPPSSGGAGELRQQAVRATAGLRLFGQGEDDGTEVGHSRIGESGELRGDGILVAHQGQRSHGVDALALESPPVGGE